MSSSLETAWAATLDTLLGPSGLGPDADIMAAQLNRAALILQRPNIDTGALFETEPATYYARLEAHAVPAAVTA